MSIQTINMTPELYDYLLKVSIRERSEELTQLRSETHKLSQYRMQISPEQGQFIALLIKLLGAKKTLDIGTFTGYSSLVVALALPEEGKVVTCDVSKEWTDIAKKFWQAAGVTNKIDLRLQPALTTLQDLLREGEAHTFDFAFIDADKRNYLEYYELALALVRHGGLIAVDNVLWGGRVADIHNQEKETKTIREFNEFIFNDERVNMSLIPIGDGLTLAMKK